ncbi:hypothetical protein, partial [Elstera litoralis]|uniref:hypothetical protein n=1 Tax=Elstera litoralis TaxID=552518 RepID=UPI001E3B4CBA
MPEDSFKPPETHAFQALTGDAACRISPPHLNRGAPVDYIGIGHFVAVAVRIVYEDLFREAERDREEMVC